MNLKPPMPAEDLIDLICDDGSDYCDGDDPGWVAASYDPSEKVLTLTYEPDPDSEPACTYRATTRRFLELL